jgi:MocE subfamily Rieske [2Fe-2S] domain protein
MSKNTATEVERNRYSLVGPEAARAVARGLAEAQWYASPVPRDKMRELLERRDQPAIRDTIIWFALLFGFGIAGYLLWGTWWAILPFACYGVIYASSSDPRWHEAGHGTAFKTDWMNNVLYEIASFMVLRESTRWRWSHARHHSDTIIVGRDQEIGVQRPANLWSVAANFINLQSWRAYATNIFLHASGRLDPAEATFIPDSERDKVIWRARIYLFIYAVVLALAISTRSILPLLYIGLPNLYGAWLMVIFGLTQHAGLAENVLDHRLNTRTVYMNRLNRYLYWNMGYHIEHHMFPLVPYHALPQLHELIKGDMPTPYNGLIEAYREIIPALIRQSKDANYYVKRRVPTPAKSTKARPTSRVVTAEGKPVVAGWIEVCDATLLPRADVLRFDHDRKSYAIYRTEDGDVYATAGRCTHGQGQLTDGFLQGTIIECPKHNGRFDIRDGSPQRLPVRAALQTYAVRESNGKILLDLTPAHGPGQGGRVEGR